MIALAATVNTGNPADVKGPVMDASSEKTEIQLVMKSPASTIEKMDLWDGKSLASISNIKLVPEKTSVANKPVSVKLAVGTVSVEAAVKSYFADIPIMARIAKCESQYRQHDAATGEVLRGVVNSLDRGVMQINEGYHLKTSQELGLDILTLEGNMAYARYLYSKQGTQPWRSSAPCWDKETTEQLAVM